MTKELKQALKESKSIIKNKTYSELVNKAIKRNDLNVSIRIGSEFIPLLIWHCGYPMNFDNYNYRMAELLLKEGADPNSYIIEINKGYTALFKLYT